MALPGFLGNLFPSFATDFVAIFDQDYNQLFRNARAIKAVVKEQSKLMEHPVETGALITDHRIIMPVEIDLSLVLASNDYVDVYKALRQYYFSATLLTIQTKSGIYQNQIISALPHEEDPTMYSAISIALSLKQVIFVTAQYGIVPKKVTDSTTVNTGVQQSSTATPQQTSALASAAKSLGAIK